MKRSLVNSKPGPDPMLEILDHGRKPVGVMSPDLVHKQKLKHHRAVALIYWPKGILLVSRRSHLCPDSPRCWDVTLSEHVYAGKSVYETLRQGLYSQLGLPISKLAFLQSCEDCSEANNEILTVYSATLHSDLWAQCSSQGDEIMRLDHHEVGALLAHFPRQVSSTLRFLYQIGVVFP